MNTRTAPGYARDFADNDQLIDLERILHNELESHPTLNFSDKAARTVYWPQWDNMSGFLPSATLLALDAIPDYASGRRLFVRKHITCTTIPAESTPDFPGG